MVLLASAQAKVDGEKLQYCIEIVFLHKAPWEVGPGGTAQDSIRSPRN